MLCLRRQTFFRRKSKHRPMTIINEFRRFFRTVYIGLTTCFATNNRDDTVRKSSSGLRNRVVQRVIRRNQVHYTIEYEDGASYQSLFIDKTLGTKKSDESGDLYDESGDLYEENNEQPIAACPEDGYDLTEQVIRMTFKEFDPPEIKIPENSIPEQLDENASDFFLFLTPKKCLTPVHEEPFLEDCVSISSTNDVIISRQSSLIIQQQDAAIERFAWEMKARLIHIHSPSIESFDITVTTNKSKKNKTPVFRLSPTLEVAESSAVMTPITGAATPISGTTTTVGARSRDSIMETYRNASIETVKSISLQRDASSNISSIDMGVEKSGGSIIKRKAKMIRKKAFGGTAEWILSTPPQVETIDEDTPSRSAIHGAGLQQLSASNSSEQTSLVLRETENQGFFVITSSVNQMQPENLTKAASTSRPSTPEYRTPKNATTPLAETNIMSSPNLSREEPAGLLKESSEPSRPVTKDPDSYISNGMRSARPARKLIDELKDKLSPLPSIGEVGESKRRPCSSRTYSELTSSASSQNDLAFTVSDFKTFSSVNISEMSDMELAIVKSQRSGVRSKSPVRSRPSSSQAVPKYIYLNNVPSNSSINVSSQNSLLETIVETESAVTMEKSIITSVVMEMNEEENTTIAAATVCRQQS